MFFQSLREKWAAAREEERRQEKIKQIRENFKTSANNDDIETVRTLLKDHYENILPDALGFALLTAAKENRTEMAQLLLENGADINFDKGVRSITTTYQDSQGYTRQTTTEITGMTPLIGAAIKGAIDTLELLISKHANPNKTLADGHSALMLACENGNTDCVRALLYAGADIHYRNGKNQRAFELARDHKQYEAFRLMEAAHENQHLPFVAPPASAAVPAPVANDDKTFKDDPDRPEKKKIAEVTSNLQQLAKELHKGGMT